MVRISTVIAWLVVWNSSGFAADDDSEGRPFVGGGAVLPGGKTAVVPNPTGGMDAISLADGKVIWSVGDAPTILGVFNKLVVVQARVGKNTNKVKLKLFDAATGKQAVESQAIDFPEWVSVATTHGRRFHLSAKLDGDSLIYFWDAQAFYAGGARPTPAIEEAARKNANGAVRFDLKTGKTTPLPEAERGMFVAPLEELRLGETTFKLDDRPAKIKGNPYQRDRFLIAVGPGGKALWERQIAAPVFLLPLP